MKKIASLLLLACLLIPGCGFFDEVSKLKAELKNAYQKIQVLENALAETKAALAKATAELEKNKKLYREMLE